MGSEFFLGGFGWLGIVLAGALVWLMIQQPKSRIYILILAAPGIALAIAAVPGQVGWNQVLDLSFMFFAVGTLLMGTPLAGLYWFWRKHRSPRPGTLQ